LDNETETLATGQMLEVSHLYVIGGGQSIKLILSQ